ncbi:MAG: DUF2085 domain-containing protein [Euryarchaeota archaeon]|nr:DUF2085 domain-containing protein [Euryarchaeota archaeon]MBV1728858.1 DUF2085 domain-containing protein [Methanobacterium sp.]MBU4547859.1 DUF2085 domain-containing protein [Euryarchaeota archaeon]MBU4607580.1 DUF2085 domain-containing protein [Euryarchaeota archaeon]MBV1754869.1 DUF2085 domain-containing protein [Methanobacterium sp.]
MKIYPICHRIPERTFKIKGYYFPVCSRCTGIYTGAIIYYILVYFFYVEYDLYLILIAALMVIPTFIDGFTQFLGYRESNNQIRFISGFFAGLGIAILVKAFKIFILTWHFTI